MKKEKSQQNETGGSSSHSERKLTRICGYGVNGKFYHKAHLPDLSPKDELTGVIIADGYLIDFTHGKRLKKLHRPIHCAKCGDTLWPSHEEPNEFELFAKRCINKDNE